MIFRYHSQFIVSPNVILNLNYLSGFLQIDYPRVAKKSMFIFDERVWGRRMHRPTRSLRLPESKNRTEVSRCTRTPADFSGEASEKV